MPVSKYSQVGENLIPVPIGDDTVTEAKVADGAIGTAALADAAAVAAKLGSDVYEITEANDTDPVRKSVSIRFGNGLQLCAAWGVKETTGTSQIGFTNPFAQAFTSIYAMAASVHNDDGTDIIGGNNYNLYATIYASSLEFYIIGLKDRDMTSPLPTAGVVWSMWALGRWD